ncbi:hypothetical protein CC85DRAFT_326988 [Cutaneotrichosporon oleaginosum]|uniref:Uncharacterized protein n=1 Tax=Cutaneotrichosporon oleaginosum TaxID=879819 RepID=A0A0J0XRU2_9TREE|nr:uncharacterized protein CC85DRAFT_326988 [Cutaneotrichosporon oleaginosum]KLT43851.1 hypothetical protein CC85DRAFT_326988 [Cutaneotrichosporon oleaginosum]TXT06409.1 hypothetical protein COLE_05740 [Cutaneotrichosporon oleaginosum]
MQHPTMVAFTALALSSMVALGLVLLSVVMAAPIFDAPSTSHRGRLKARIGTNLCLGVSGTRDGARLLLKSCTHASTEVEFDDDRDLLIFLQAQRVAEVPARRYGNGEAVQIRDIATHGGSGFQRWVRADFHGRSGGGVPRGVWQQIRTGNHRYCLDVREGRAVVGAEVQLRECAPWNDNQSFKWIS